MTSSTTSTETAAKQLTERQIIERARRAQSSSNWTIGECAADWTERFAKGRTDSDFGALIGLSRDQVCQRRLVWIGWNAKRDTYHKLKWSHFYTANKWADSEQCLEWANDNEATVAEMKAFHRMQNGEDVTESNTGDADDFAMWTAESTDGSVDSVDAVMSMPAHDPSEDIPQHANAPTLGVEDPNKDRTKLAKSGNVTGRCEASLRQWRKSTTTSTRNALLTISDQPAAMRSHLRLLMQQQLTAMAEDIGNGESAEMVDGLDQDFDRALSRHLSGDHS